MSLIKESLENLHVKCKLAPPAINDRGMETLRLRVGGHDLRKEMFKGWVEVERFVYRSGEGSFCVMKRDEVSLRDFFLCVSWRTDRFFRNFFEIILGKSYLMATTVEGIDQVIIGGTACSSEMTFSEVIRNMLRIFW